MLASRRARCYSVLIPVAAVAACGHSAALTVADGTGPTPQLPPPRTSLIPTVKVSEAKGWETGEHPAAMSGTTVTAFANGLEHPRWLYVLPNGDVLVAETNAPSRPDDAKGIKGWFVNHYAKKAGAAVKSADRITLLRDADGDGIAESRTVLIDSLTSPFGMVLIDNYLYVANTDGVVRFPYTRGQMQIAALGVPVSPLPAGPINHHWTKNIVASRDGTKLYATVGSNSNAGENGIDNEKERAAVWEIDLTTGNHRIFASGLRNPVGLAWEPTTGALWTSVNERDELGSDIVPDYMTALRDGAFYGFPYSYFGRHVDPRVKEERPDLVAKAVVPDYALGSAHGVARTCVVATELAAAGVTARRDDRLAARIVESEAAKRLQGDFHSLRERQAIGSTSGCRHRVPGFARQRQGPAGRRSVRQARRAADRR